MCAVLLAFPLVAPTLLKAQDDYSHNNITFGVGAGDPTGSLSSYMSTAPAITIRYGYRFYKYLQADIGLNMFFGAANVSAVLPTYTGNLNIGDREYMLPMGGRGILPLMGGRLELSGGGGAIWMHYSEHLSQPAYSYYSYNCPICTARGGWGGYFLAAGNYFLDENHHISVGVTSEFIRGHTSGSAVGDVPGTKTTDHWNDVYATIGLSF